MDDAEFSLLLPRAINMALRLRKRIDAFHSHLYDAHDGKKIGYGHKIALGITEPAALLITKTRLHTVGTALMQRAFETNLAADSARFSVFIDIAERVGDGPVLQETPMWQAVKEKDYWKLNEAFLTSPLITAYGPDKEGRRRVAYLGRVLVEGASAL